MKKSAGRFRRRANPLPMVFRLSFLYSFLSFPAFYVFRGFSREAVVDLLGVFFSVLILMTVFLIRLRAFINGRTDRLIAEAGGSGSPAEDGSPSGEELTELRQSFSLRSYAGLNAEVMFSYLRPYLSLLSGLAFLVIFVYAVLNGIEITRTGLAFALTLYYLSVPWLLFLFKTRKVYQFSKAYLDIQVLDFKAGCIGVRAGDSPRKEVKQLVDIAITRNYLLLFIAGSNYLQVQRRLLEGNREKQILTLARDMVVDEA